MKFQVSVCAGPGRKHLDRFCGDAAQIKIVFLLATKGKSPIVQREAIYLKDPKFSDNRKLCCNHSKIQTKRPNLRVLCQNDANGVANSEDPHQTAPLGTV